MPVRSVGKGALKRQYDYIIVGAGSAGCVLAERLSADEACSVLLIEAGPRDNHWHLSMPAALTYPLRGTRFNWAYETEPQPELHNRTLFWPRGRVLGGSSSINGMVWIRGHPWDYDNWYNQGLDGWAWCQMLPYFKRLERWSQGADDYRGGDGPVGVVRSSYRNPIFDAYVAAGGEAGFPVSEDFNGRQFEGFGRFDMNIWKGRRQNASFTHLKSALHRSNLTVLTGCLVSRVLFEGTRASGVQYLDGSARHKILCDGEVILSGGALNSPQLLMLSGVGPAGDLRRHGIDTVLDLPGVGQNLQDHLNTSLKYECLKPVTLYGTDRFPRNALIGLQYALFRTGAGATMHTEVGCFVKAGDNAPLPDIQHHFVPILVYDNGRTPPDRHGFQVHVCPLRPKSRGHLTLRSADPRDAPLLQPNCLSEPGDAALMCASIKLTREAMAQPAMAEFCGRELAPGPDVQSDAQLMEYLRSSSVTCYHPVGTCRMGNDDRAVVDAELRVHGADGLRVVDASVIPELVSGNTNAPIMGMADRASDLALGKETLAPEDVVIADYDPIASAQLRETRAS